MRPVGLFFAFAISACPCLPIAQADSHDAILAQAAHQRATRQLRDVLRRFANKARQIFNRSLPVHVVVHGGIAQCLLLRVPLSCVRGSCRSGWTPDPCRAAPRDWLRQRPRTRRPSPRRRRIGAKMTHGAKERIELRSWVR